MSSGVVPPAALITPSASARAHLTSLLLNNIYLTQQQIRINKMSATRKFEHKIDNIDGLLTTVKGLGCDHALVKVLGKNANDKNQVYWNSDFNMLNQIHDFHFQERAFSTSTTKPLSNTRARIPEGIFKSFYWVDTEHKLVAAKNAKMLIYAQYPEMRLSGFKTIENQIPESLSVEFTKANPDVKRLFVLGRVPGTGAVAFMVIADDYLVEQVRKLRGHELSQVVKVLLDGNDKHGRLMPLLAKVANTWIPGVRFNKKGETIPFNSTQVCGYTLEHALDIRPNADKNGDFEGIELKTHTMRKVSLMTPEPDMGLYAKDFKAFMTDPEICYLKPDGSWRFTGIHKTGNRCARSNLTMEIVNYDPNEKNFSKQLNKDIYVGLFKPDGTLAAGWSLERLMNCWGAKHNEAVYIPAEKRAAEGQTAIDMGCANEVRFANTVMWCKGTGPDKLLRAIYEGIIILDPAPKYVPEQPKLTKRRCQWRVNDISAALPHLYESFKEVAL
ncbi:MvaI/BcnI family restriction endonuclease [Aestuariibacter salexigens]|uniref:MvaI/BcnI family restriction endonuclease n=1 Tax=Aestuariibacter salexigens TaxID=226010 RepID=UPI00146FC266|nr:MvaI/BcnI family restriction endonuclease [Aestuariibacter salexigens]